MTRLGGVSVRTSVRRHVSLVCPRCGDDSDGTVLDMQRWYYVWGVPTLPLAKLESVVECDECGYQSGLGLLEIPTADMLAARLEVAMRLAVTSTVRAAAEGAEVPDLDVTDEAVDVMRSSGFQYGADDLRHDLAATSDADVAESLHLLADDLTPHGKQGFLHRMISIALVDGDVSRAEQQALVKIGVALGMAAPHINGILATAAQYQAA
jgi:hypothetical protein